MDWRDGRFPSLASRVKVADESAVESEVGGDTSYVQESLKPVRVSASRRESITKRVHELAGGIEDWEDVSGQDVDRYGFITTRKRFDRPGTPEPRPPQRVSTVSHSPTLQ